MLADDALLLFVPLILNVLLIALLVDCAEARKKAGAEQPQRDIDEYNKRNAQWERDESELIRRQLDPDQRSSGTPSRSAPENKWRANGVTRPPPLDATRSRRRFARSIELKARCDTESVA
jgi:hypothetical protein